VTGFVEQMYILIACCMVNLFCWLETSVVWTWNSTSSQKLHIFSYLSLHRTSTSCIR